MEVSGLGASAKELMELQEQIAGFPIHTKGKHQQSVKKGKDKKDHAEQNDGDEGPSMRELLMQDEISSDSDSERRGDNDDDSDADADSDDEDKAKDREGAAAAAATASATAASTPTAELTAAEALYVLEGDENHTKRTSTTSSSGGVKSALQSAKQGLVTGDSVRDQLLREALGVDPAAISESSDLLIGQSQSQGLGDVASASAASGEEVEEPVSLKAWILPLYALMPAALQNRVFQPPPPGWFVL